MVIVRFGRGRFGGVRVAVVAVEELDNVEPEPVHVEVDVARLEIGGAGLPDADFGVEPFDGAPCCLSDSHAVAFWKDEEEFKFAAEGEGARHKAVFSEADGENLDAYGLVPLGLVVAGEEFVGNPRRFANIRVIQYAILKPIVSKMTRRKSGETFPPRIMAIAK